MAKYRITSIPQSLPQAKKGLTILNKENVTPELVPVQGIAPSSYWDQMQSPYMTESTKGYGTTQGCPPGKVYGGIGMDGIDRGCVTPQELQEQDRQDRLRVTKIEEGWAIEDAAKQKMAEDKYIKEETERIKKQNIAWQGTVKNYYDKYKEANTKNLKTKFIKPEPILILSPSDVTPEKEKEIKNAYYINKNKKTGKIELYPREIMNNRIMNNGYKVSDFEKWGFDKEQITSEFEPTMKLAHEVFTNTMTNKIVTRALKEGKTVDQVISELPTKLGGQAGLTKDFKKSTEKIITDLFNSTQQNIVNSIPSTDKDQVASGENIFRKSNDPVASWNDANHPNDFAYQFQQFNNQTNALSEYDKAQAEKNKNLIDKTESFGNLMYGDTNAKVREQNILGLNQMNLKKDIDKRTAVGYEAKNKDAIDALTLYKQNFGADILKSGVEKKLNAIKNDPKTQIEFLKSLNDDIGKSTITGENETLNNLFNDEDIKSNINFAWSRNNFGRNDDAISEGRTNQYNINDHPWDKVKDVLYNPIPAFDAWMNPRKTMWGNSNMSYTEREKIKDETGVDMGTINYDSPLGVFHNMFNAANPIKVGADVRQGYDNGHFWSSLGESLSNAGMAVAPIKGANALGNLAKGAGFRKGVGALLSGFSNPAFNAGFALQAPQNFSNAGTNFQEGNYGTAAWDALMGVQGVMSPLRATTNLLRYGQTPTKAFNLGVTTPSGKYYGFKQANIPLPNLSYATSNEALASELGLTDNKAIKTLYKQFHPDAGIYSGQVGSNASANLGNLTSVPNRTSWVPGFNRTYPINIDSGKVGIVESPAFNLKNNYKFNFGENRFKPLTAEELLLRPSPETYQFNPLIKSNSSSGIQFNPKLLGFKKGGSLPKAWNGLEILKNTGKLINEFKTPIQALKNFNTPVYTNLANIGMDSFFKSIDPATMDLIANLKNKKLISPSLPEGSLVTYPNLLNLATKKGIQDALTFSRSTAGTDFGISSSGTKTTLAPGDLAAYKKFGIENDEIGKGLYGATHVPFMRYGQRTGLTNLPYKTEQIKIYKFGEGETDYVVADTIEEAQQTYLNQFGQNIDPSKLTKDYIQQGSPDSFDALYTFANNTGLPKSVNKGIFDDQYGKFTSILRYPFDYSGSAYDMLSKFNGLEQRTFANAENLRRTQGREFPLPGSIGAYTFTDKPTPKNSFIAPIFTFPETPVIGRPGQKLFDPVATYYKPELEEIDKEMSFVGNLYSDKKYDELINFLNDKIKAGQFGSIESNIQSIKESPEFPKFKFEAIRNENMNNYLHMLDAINPKTGLIDTGLKGEELKNLANSAWQSYGNYMHFGPRENALYKTDNVKKIPYSPFRFKFKKGGALPKAWDGLQVARTAKAISNFIKPIPEWKASLNSLLNLEGALPSMQPIMQKVSKIDPNRILNYYKGVNEVPMADLENLSKTTGGNSLIQYGNEPFQGESFYHADPLDYPGIKDWKNEANIDANNSLDKYLSNKPQYGSDTFKGVGDFNFAAGSDGWEVRNDLSNLASFGIEPSGPQWVPGKEDFYTLNEISNLSKKQVNHLNNWNTFNEMYPENPSEAIFRGLTGDTSREELFSNLFPNSSIQNFKQKFYRPEHIDLMKQSTPDALGNTLYDNLTNNTNFGDQGMLNPRSLKTINTGFETLPKTYQQLLKNSKGNDFLQTGPAKIVVSEMRGSLGLSLNEILNASPEQLEKWRRQIVIKMGKQDLERWESDISKPLTVQDAWKEISKQAGYKNKNGGVVTKLSQKEIEEYVKGGYIIEEE
jgi:hypothetical protein